MPATIEAAVRDRYAKASQAHEACLCVPSSGYDAELLKVLPDEIVQRDYGCGDPSRHVRRGETVLDLGSGGGKVCYICAQKVGPTGRVIGVDFNPPMLALARQYQQPIGDALGYHNVDFRHGRIQDLRLDLDVLDRWLTDHPVTSADAYLALQDHAAHLSATAPMVPDASVDVVVSNCVLNLVGTGQKRDLFAEMFRVLKVGGRCVISDIVADRDVPQALQDDPDLWSGCISGAFREDAFLAAFEHAGFHGLSILERSAEPWQTVADIQFRSVTVVAHKGQPSPGVDRDQAVIYRGPFKSVTGDDGHTYQRGQRTPVSANTFALLQREPTAELFYFVDPHRKPLPLGTACCGTDGCC